MLVPSLMSGPGRPCDSARGARSTTSSSHRILRPGPPSGPRWVGSIIRRRALRRNPTRSRSRRLIRGTRPCTHLVGKRVDTGDRGSGGARAGGAPPPAAGGHDPALSPLVRPSGPALPAHAPRSHGAGAAVSDVGCGPCLHPPASALGHVPRPPLYAPLPLAPAPRDRPLPAPVGAGSEVNRIPG